MVTRPVMPLLRLAFPNFILATEQLGRAMIAVAQGGERKRILESRDILALSRITQPTNRGMVENNRTSLISIETISMSRIGRRSGPRV